MTFLDPAATATPATQLNPVEPVAPVTPPPTDIAYSPFSLAQNVPVVGQLFGGGQSAAPVYTNQPQNQRALATKYQDPKVNAAVTQLPAALRASLMNLDVTRVNRGQAPLDKNQTLLAAQTLQSGQPATPAAQPNPYLPQNIAHNFLGDIKTLTMNIPHIPGQLIGEARAIPKIGEQLSQAKSFADYLRLPGVRLIPGTMTAANLLSGQQGLQQAVSHPLLTALDVAPFAKAQVLAPTAEATRVAEEAGTTAAKRSVGDVLGATRPGQALGNLKQSAIDALANTRPGQLATEAFGKQSRQLSMLENLATHQLQERFNTVLGEGEVPTTALQGLVSDTRQLANDFTANVPPARQAELMEAARTGDVANLPGITDVERGYVQRHADLQQHWGNYAVDQGTLKKLDNEFYTPEDYTRITTSPNPEQALAQTAPARFQPLIRKLADQKLIAYYATDNNLDQISRAVADHSLSTIPGYSPEVLSGFVNDIKSTWQQLRARGEDPIFVHNVAPSQVGSTILPKALTRVPKIGQLMSRSMDAGPTVNSFTASLSHQALEYLQPEIAQHLIQTVGETFGRSNRELVDQFLPQAQRMAARNPSLGIDGALQQLISKQYVPFNESNLAQWSLARPTSIAESMGERTYLPRAIVNNLERMRQPVQNGLTAAIDPVMKTFRTAVLPLSLRWHFNNLFGNLLMVAGQTGPGVVNYVRPMIDLLRGAEETVLPSGEKVGMSDFLKMQLQSSTAIQREADLAAAGFGRRILNQIAESRGEGTQQAAQVTGDALARVGKGFNKVVETSYKWQSFIDDAFRGAAYLYGYDKSITKGLTEDASRATGETLVRKSLQTWSELTPIERSVMRYMFPFYGFAQHIVRYAYNYPIDHPFRSAVLATLANAEITDHKDALPDKFLNALFFGKMDEKGNQRAINIGGMNPFRDVASYFTIAGLVGQSNPIVKTLFDQMGINTQTGQPDMYPTVAYDPETGRLRAQSKDPFTNFLSNVLPQSQILTGLAQSGSEFRGLMQSDPNAAMRLLRSQAGLPVVFRTFNLPQEEVKAELAREQAQQQTMTTALKTGNYADASTYPQLRTLQSRVAQLQQSGQLAAYTPQNIAPTPLQVAQQALVNANAPGYTYQPQVAQQQSPQQQPQPVGG